MKIEKRIKKIIKRASNIFIVGHKNLDLDAIGSCIGVSCLCNYYRKENYIIIDDEKHELGVSKILDELKEVNNIIKSAEIPKNHKQNSILVIVDTNKAHLLQNEEILKYFNEIIILDHHQNTEQTIPNTINIIDDTKSSAGEIVTDLLKKCNVKIPATIATIILSGIVLDTNNFTVKTSSNTYHAAYYLANCGADPKKVQYYLKEDLKDYIIRHKVIMNVKVINDKYAVSVANLFHKYKREDLAKIADSLLNFNNIEASFVLGLRTDGGVGLSARSIGNINVGKIAEQLGGGGDNYNAACQMLDKSLATAKKELLEVLNKED